MASHNLAHSRSAWEEARILFDMARNDANAFCNLSDDECDLYANAQYTAELALLRCPAPDAEALAYKLEVFRDEEGFALGTPIVREILDLIIDDLGRVVNADG